jgi:hypothetical protein
MAACCCPTRSPGSSGPPTSSRRSEPGGHRRRRVVHAPTRHDRALPARDRTTGGRQVNRVAHGRGRPKTLGPVGWRLGQQARRKRTGVGARLVVRHIGPGRRTHSRTGARRGGGAPAFLARVSKYSRVRPRNKGTTERGRCPRIGTAEHPQRRDGHVFLPGEPSPTGTARTYSSASRPTFF